MNACRCQKSNQRTGFTLVEMLVVIFIMLTLATIVVSLTPRFTGTRNLTRGAEQLQGILLMAKSWARKDQLPTGVRLQQDGNGLVRIVQLIQQPDVFTGGTVQYNPGSPNHVRGAGVDFAGGFGPGSPALWPVQPGDYLEIKGGGLVHRILSVEFMGNAGVGLALASSPPNQVFSTADYRIIRQPRILTGETPLELPPDIAIDASLSQGVQWAGPAGQASADILFSPGGAMIGPASNAETILWVRDTSLDRPTDGEPVLITVYSRTGLIAAHPINLDTNLGDYYVFTRDGRSSGL